MQTLFGFEEPKTSLQISATPKAQLTKAQIQFNQLVTRIEKLQQEIPLEEAKYDSLLLFGNQHMLPMHEKIAQERLQLAISLDRAASKIDFRKDQIKDIGTIIEDLLNGAFQYIEPSEATKELYAKWTGTTLDEAAAQDEAEEKEMMQDLFEAMFGIKIDLDELKRDPDLAQKIQDQIDEKTKKESTKGQKRGRKPKAGQTKKEAIAKATEELKSKSLRSIYISLAKLLHPDTESDPDLRAAKEEEMKKISAAYEANDLATLLKMEMEWIHKQNNTLDTIPEDKILLYIQVLKDQIKELEESKISFRRNPRYITIAEFATYRTETALKKIKQEAADLKDLGDELETVRKSFDVSNPKKRIDTFIREYHQQMNALNFFF
jgi:hypothetical protein